MRLFQSIRRPLGGFMMDQQFAEDPQVAQAQQAQRAETARLNFYLGKLLRRVEMIMHTLDETLALVTAERTDVASIAALTAGLKKQLDDALAGVLTPTQQMRVDAIFDQAQQNKQAIADAVKANDDVGDNITDTTVTSSNTRSTVGDSVTFTAAVAKHPDAPTDKSPTGLMSFSVDGTQVGTSPVGTDGTAASAPISTLAVGDHSVIATYSGDTVFATSASQPLTQTVVEVVSQPAPGPVAAQPVT